MNSSTLKNKLVEAVQDPSFTGVKHVHFDGLIIRLHVASGVLQNYAAYPGPTFDGNLVSSLKYVHEAVYNFIMSEESKRLSNTMINGCI